MTLIVRMLPVDSWRRYDRNEQCLDPTHIAFPPGLYGLWKLHEITGDEDSLKIATDWFRDRFNVGTSKVSGSNGRSNAQMASER
jgi:hypothetical protein